MKITLMFLMAVIGLMVYVEIRVTRLTMNGDQYQQVGVMKYSDNGNDLYIPVYRRK